MWRWSYLPLAFLLVSSAPDVPHGASAVRSDGSAISSGMTLPSLSEIFLSVTGHADTRQSSLQLKERLEIVRFLDKEFARIVRPLPVEKNGFRYSPRAPLDEAKLSRAISSHTTGNPGDTVQITDIRFEQNAIVIEINGGAKGRFRLFDHLHASMGPESTPNGQGGSAPGQTTSPAPLPGPGSPPDSGPDAGPGSIPGPNPGQGTAPPPAIPPASAPPGTPNGTSYPQSSSRGATLVLDYGQSIPDMGPDDLKRDLSVFLSFAGEHSAAVNWVDTLPPQFREAIKDRRALVGMNADMVLAALGRPDQKVRETRDDGSETEDWIYGRPPGKTVFVTFLNSKVTRVEQFP
jgi:hypothetical protein